MSGERWFAARSRQAGMKPLRMLGQPEDGFASVTGVMDWLEAEGLIGPPVFTEDGGKRWPHWGNPYCAVAGSRNDPWEGTR